MTDSKERVLSIYPAAKLESRLFNQTVVFTLSVPHEGIDELYSGWILSVDLSEDATWDRAWYVVQEEFRKQLER